MSIYAKFAFAFCAIIVVQDCSTPEYSSEKNICEKEWAQRLPPMFGAQVETKYRTEMVPTGKVRCETSTFGSSSTTLCEEVMRKEKVPYTVTNTVDLNRDKRRSNIRSCTERRCSAKYGNPNCSKD